MADLIRFNMAVKCCCRNLHFASDVYFVILSCDVSNMGNFYHGCGIGVFLGKIPP
jgi:hypothetical protein